MERRMEVAFFTEGGYQGKVSRNNANMRTDLAWVCALEADHYPLHSITQIPNKKYDLGIAILPKNKKPFLNLDVAGEMQRVCKVCSVMQESNYYLWQDNPIEDQVWYLNNLNGIDFMFVHNNIDLQYYSGLIEKPCEKLPTVMVSDYVKPSTNKNDSVIIGGNLVSIYRGIDSFMVARELDLPIYALSSGRKPPREEELGINHLPWITWLNWMEELSKFKYAVHIGTGGAGSFNLNCAYLGIPCVGLKALETQNLCFPDLSIDDVNLKEAKKLTRKLKNDKDFYNHCVQQGQENHTKHFAESKFVSTLNNIYNKHYNQKYK